LNKYTQYQTFIVSLRMNYFHSVDTDSFYPLCLACHSQLC